jgi:hypothetical protein
MADLPLVKQQKQRLRAVEVLRGRPHFIHHYWVIYTEVGSFVHFCPQQNAVTN